MDNSWDLPSKHLQYPSFSLAKLPGDFYAGLNQFLRAGVSVAKQQLSPVLRAARARFTFFPLRDVKKLPNTDE